MTTDDLVSLSCSNTPLQSESALEMTPKVISAITVHRQAILLLVVESGTRKFRCLSVEWLFVKSGTYDVICQFCTVKGMVVESEILKAQSCALGNKACLCTLMAIESEINELTSVEQPSSPPTEVVGDNSQLPNALED